MIPIPVRGSALRQSQFVGGFLPSCKSPFRRQSYFTQHQLYEEARLSNLPQGIERHKDLLRRANDTLKMMLYPRREREIKAIEELLGDVGTENLPQLIIPKQPLGTFHCNELPVREKPSPTRKQLRERRARPPQKSGTKKKKETRHRRNISLGRLHPLLRLSQEGGSPVAKSISPDCRQPSQCSLKTAVADFIRKVDIERGDICRYRHRIETKLKQFKRTESDASRQQELGQLYDPRQHHYWTEQMSKYRKVLNHNKLMDIQRGRVQFQQHSPY